MVNLIDGPVENNGTLGEAEQTESSRRLQRKSTHLEQECGDAMYQYFGDMIRTTRPVIQLSFCCEHLPALQCRCVSPEPFPTLGPKKRICLQ